MRNNKSRITILATIAVVMTLGVSGTYAQGNLQKIDNTWAVEEISETETEATNQYFDIYISRGGQSAFTGNITYTVQITPHIDSLRTQIQWDVPIALKVRPKHKEFISMQKGVTYTLKASVKPEKAGVYSLTLSAISWQHDTNYTNSASDELTFNKSLILQPVSQSYVIGNIVKYLTVFLLAGGAVFAIIKIVKKYSPKARKWLTPPV